MLERSERVDRGAAALEQLGARQPDRFRVRVALQGIVQDLLRLRCSPASSSALPEPREQISCPRPRRRAPRDKLAIAAGRSPEARASSARMNHS